MPLGSFTIWSGWVHVALVWQGEADPCETMEGMRGADPKLKALTAVLEEWRPVIGFKSLAAGQLRDATWLAPVVLRLHELDQFEVAALFIGFITSSDSTAGGLSGTNTGGR